MPPGRIVTILGANGAGKSTALQAISGLVHPQKGTIELEGRPITDLSPAAIVRLGISQVPEGRELFPLLTVRENLFMGAYTRTRSELAPNIDRVFAHFPILLERQRQIASTLSGGEQQMLAIGRSLMSAPRYLLLDEPSLGLAPKIVRKIFEILQTINSTGVSILLVEQNANLALRTANYAYVLEIGKIVLEGQALELRQSSHVRRAYLGG